MARILSKILLILLIAHVVQYFLVAILIRPVFENIVSGESGGTINYVIKNSGVIDYIVLGSSRAKHGIDPSLLSSVKGNGYNLGINGTNIINSNIVLEILIKNEVKPKTIILQTDLRDFLHESNEKDISDQIKRLYPYREDGLALNKYIAMLSWEERLKSKIDLYQFNGKIINIFFNYFKRKNIKANNGYVPLYGQINQFNQPYNSSSTTVNEKYYFNNLMLEALLDIQNMCIANNIKLIVVFPPFYNNQFYDENNFKTLTKDLTSRGVNNIIDISNVNKYKDIQDSDNWKDEGHLNSTGTIKFTRILNSKIKNKEYILH